MNALLSLAGRWQQTSDDMDAVFDFAADGMVTWEGKSRGRFFRCRGVYTLDATLVPSVLKIGDVEIMYVDACPTSESPAVEEGLVLRFYQEFEGEDHMRMQGMAVDPKNDPVPPRIVERPDVMRFHRIR